MFIWLLQKKQLVEVLYHGLLSFIKRLTWLFQTKQRAWGLEFSYKLDYIDSLKAAGIACRLDYAQANLSAPDETRGGLVVRCWIGMHICRKSSVLSRERESS